MIQSILQCFRQPYLLITIAFILTVVEGSLRKWVPGFSDGVGRTLAYFSKDLVILLTIPLALQRARIDTEAAQRLNRLFRVCVTFFIAGAAMSSIHGINAVGALLSIRAVILLPLAAVLYIRSTTSFPLPGFLVIVIALTGVNFFLSLLQTTLPASHILNKYAMGGDYGVAELSQGVRATGTFAYISGLSIMSTIGVWAGLTLLALATNGLVRAIGIFGLLTGLGCAFNSFSRSPLVLAAAVAIAFLFGALKRGRNLLLPLILSVAFLFALPVAFPDLSGKIMNSVNGTVDRLENAGDNSVNRAFGQWSELLEAFQISPFGNGLGTEQVAGSFVNTGSSSFNHYENQLPRFQNEFGVLGLIGFFILCYCWASGISIAHLRSNNQTRIAILVTQVFVLSQCYTNIVYNHIASSAVWIICTVTMCSFTGLNEGTDDDYMASESKELPHANSSDSSSSFA